MQSWLIELLLHLIFYLTIFIGSAYYAGEYREPNSKLEQKRLEGLAHISSVPTVLPSRPTTPHRLIIY